VSNLSLFLSQYTTFFDIYRAINKKDYAQAVRVLQALPTDSADDNPNYDKHGLTSNANNYETMTRINGRGWHHIGLPGKRRIRISVQRRLQLGFLISRIKNHTGKKQHSQKDY